MKKGLFAAGRICRNHTNMQFLNTADEVVDLSAPFPLPDPAKELTYE